MVKLPQLRIDAFQFIYVITAVATALHTAWGAARTMQGLMPQDVAGQVIWWINGVFFAIAIDVAMYVIAKRIRAHEGATEWLIVSFILAAVFSSYFQLLYAWVHSAPIVDNGGVAPEWQMRLGGIINSATVIAPFMLPLLGIAYTLTGLGHRTSATKEPEKTLVVRDDKPFISTPSDLPDSVQKVKALPAKTSVRSPKAKVLNAGVSKRVVCPGCSGEFAPGSIWRHKQSCSEYIALQISSEVVQ